MPTRRRRGPRAWRRASRSTTRRSRPAWPTRSCCSPVKRTYVKGKQFWAITLDDKSVTVAQWTANTTPKPKTSKFRTPEKAEEAYRAQLEKLPAGFKQLAPKEQINAELE